MYSLTRVVYAASSGEYTLKELTPKEPYAERTIPASGREEKFKGKSD
jgi:hypothetical protein